MLTQVKSRLEKILSHVRATYKQVWLVLVITNPRTSWTLATASRRTRLSIWNSWRRNDAYRGVLLGLIRELHVCMLQTSMPMHGGTMQSELLEPAPKQSGAAAPM